MFAQPTMPSYIELEPMLTAGNHLPPDRIYIPLRSGIAAEAIHTPEIIKKGWFDQYIYARHNSGNVYFKVHEEHRFLPLRRFLKKVRSARIVME